MGKCGYSASNALVGLVLCRLTTWKWYSCVNLLAPTLPPAAKSAHAETQMGRGPNRVENSQPATTQMPAYAGTSFLVRAYIPHADSPKALALLQHARAPLPFTALHRHELRHAIRLRVFRGEITAEQRKLAFLEIESDLTDNILAHTPVPWADTFRESEDLAAIHTEQRGVRSFDLLHVGLALALKATEFLTCDRRQAPSAFGEGGGDEGETVNRRKERPPTALQE